jgi:2-oxoglutarate ferredoxin oxidoreductase subunit alpha
MREELTLGIGGAAGEGIGAPGNAVGQLCARLGLHVYSYNEYQSLVKGGHIWLRIRMSKTKVENHGDHLNVALAFNQDTLNRHAQEVEPGGAVIFNGGKLSLEGLQLQEDVTPIPLPITEIMEPFGRLPAIMQNTVMIGAVMWVLGLDFPVLKESIREEFLGRGKGEEVANTNADLAQAGYDYARSQYPHLGDDWGEFSRVGRAVVTGNEMFGFGALAAGCAYYTAYPMTPASGILHLLAKYGPRHGMVVKQMEDEIAVLNSAIGAGFAGVRAMCGTSGGGFALMTEAVGMAGMTETPVVIVECQRGGPSTGLPTKTEQGDLNQAYGASQGDYPRVIFAPTDAIDCFNAIPEAFNLAERWQIPVIVLSDLYLSEHNETIDPEAVNFAVEIDRGEIVRELPPENGYLRFRHTASGVSPRVLPGTLGGVHTTATDEHDQRGALISDEYTNPPERIKMMDKRMRKMEGILREVPPPVLEGPAEADVTLIGWGSTTGLIREAIGQLAETGVTANHVQFRYLVPFHADEARAILSRARFTIMVEVNYSGQFERHLRAETGLSVDAHVRKYDGEPMEPAYLTERILEVLNVSVG